MDATNWRHGWILREVKHGTIIGSTADQPSGGGGAGLYSDIVDINEHYISYINYNYKLV